MRDRDRGATALTIAITMVLLMGIAAVVIDGGRGFSEKRQAQSAVDFAALAAIVAATGPSPADAGALEAQTVAAANLPGRTLDWAACTDPTRPPEYTIVSSTQCVSFTQNFGQVRVRLPDDAVETTFGRIIGTDSFDVVATAEAIQSTQQTADIVPFTAGSGSNVCLFSNQAPQTVPPCNGPQSGFFGYLDVALYGSPADELNNPSTCANGTSNVRSGINISKGSDHILVEWNNGDPVVNDHAVCPNRSENINQLTIQPGSPTQGATEGLITGLSSGIINGQPFGGADGRLEFNSEWSNSSASVRGFTLDDTPLWDYLIDKSCPWGGGAISGDVDNFQEMWDCLNAWSGGSIFTLALADNLRFAAVPIFTIYPTGPGSYLIDHFSPIYIETIYQNCNANRCRTIFSPGEAGGSTPCPNVLATSPTNNCGHTHTSGSDSVEAVTAFQLEVEMLHIETQEFFPATQSVRTIFLLR